jgi:hypothetical protein
VYIWERYSPSTCRLFQLNTVIQTQLHLSELHIIGMGSNIFQERWWLILVLLGCISFGESMKKSIGVEWIALHCGKLVAPANLLALADDSLWIGHGATQSDAGQSDQTLISELDDIHPSTTSASALGGALTRNSKSVVTGVDEESTGVSVESSMNNQGSVWNEPSGDLPVTSRIGLRLTQVAKIMKMDQLQQKQQQWLQASAVKLHNDRERELHANSGHLSYPVAQQMKTHQVHEAQVKYHQARWEAKKQTLIRTGKKAMERATRNDRNRQTTELSNTNHEQDSTIESKNDYIDSKNEYIEQLFDTDWAPKYSTTRNADQE